MASWLDDADLSSAFGFAGKFAFLDLLVLDNASFGGVDGVVAASVGAGSRDLGGSRLAN